MNVLELKLKVKLDNSCSCNQRDQMFPDLSCFLSVLFHLPVHLLSILKFWPVRSEGRRRQTEPPLLNISSPHSQT